MSAGTLRAEIRLDEPTRIHCGPNENVTGNVVLSFAPSTTSRDNGISELFGPLEINLTFHGRLKSKIRVKRGNKSSLYRGRIPLFNRTIKIYHDSARIASGEKWPVRFKLSFPSGFEYTITGDWEEDRRFDGSNDQPLPPSFVNDYSGFSNHYESFVEYRVGVMIRVPHVPVDIITPEKDMEPLVHYQQPRCTRALEMNHHRHKGIIDVSNELLLPEGDRPSGFRQKAKAALTSDYYPHYICHWVLLAPQHVHIGQSMAFEISIRPVEEQCTAIVVPEVRLTNFSVSLISSTIVRAEKQLLRSPEASHEETLGTIRGVLDDAGPFSKASDWRKTVDVSGLPPGTGTSFRTVNISHRHGMQVRFAFEVAGKTMSEDRHFDIAVLPPLMESGPADGPLSSSAEAGPSGQPLDMKSVRDALPRYEEGLPRYDEAADSVPAAPPKADQKSAIPSGLR